MKVRCSHCWRKVPAANLRLDTGWGKCNRCQEVFPLAQVVSGFAVIGSPTAKLPQRPAHARAIVGRTAERLLVYVPEEGMRAATLHLLVFSMLWLGFLTLGLLFAMGPQGSKGFLLYWLIPFWLIGLGLLIAAVLRILGTKYVRIDRAEMTTYVRCLWWARTRRIELDRVQQARPYLPWVSESSFPECAVEILYRSRSIVLSVDSAAEQEWLIAEINDFLQAAKRIPALGVSCSYRISQENRITDLTRIHKPG